MKEQVAKLMFSVPFIHHAVMDITARDWFFLTISLQEILGLILPFIEQNCWKQKEENLGSDLKTRLKRQRV